MYHFQWLNQTNTLGTTNRPLDSFLLLLINVVLVKFSEVTKALFSYTNCQQANHSTVTLEMTDLTSSVVTQCTKTLCDIFMRNSPGNNTGS